MSRLIQPEQRFKLAGESGKANDYTERVIKYVPTEIIAGYLFVIGFIKPLTKNDDMILPGVVIFAVFFLLVPIYFKLLAKSEPFITQSVIAMVAFIIWIYNISDLPVLLNIYASWVGALLLVVFTILSGLIKIKPGDK
ncbi:MAG: hypothetical protein ISS16_07075 [Ignavibacteria bacterium]|nr:hypothetical protein [Ignavibacteria bacterium]